MHMADALVSPAVGGAMWVGAAGLAGWSARRVRLEADDRRAPLMGVLGAFVFSAQMINFAIPGTGSSGHLGGGLLLAILLGPHAAYLTIASVLAVQALFFADGGLLALGCNMLNLGLFPCFIAYPLIYRPIAGAGDSRGRVFGGAVAASLVGLSLGALAVVLQTAASGISELPISTFLAFMLPIHLAIGFVEGVVTALVVLFVHQARPELVQSEGSEGSLSMVSLGAVLLGVAVAVGGLLSWFAAESPDGLEWSMARTSGVEELEAPATGVHAAAESAQASAAFLPDYSLPGASERVGASVSGIVGAGLTLALVAGFAFVLRRSARRPAA